MKRQGGFTLIELVVVIVILGILAVTAAPRFLNLQGDARNSALKGLQGAINGASGIVYGKSAIAGLENASSGTVGTGTNAINIVYGYPDPTVSGVAAAIEGFSNDWAIVSPASPTVNTASVWITFAETSAAYASNECYLTYTPPATSGATATATVDPEACK